LPRANPRQAAFAILQRIEKERSYADILLDRELSQGGLQGPDRGLLTELVYGVLRRRGTLDFVINQCSRIRTDRLEHAVLNLLRLGLYQILYLDRIPVAAAVNETVKLARSCVPRAAGFVNAVLRQADRQRDDISFPDRDRDLIANLAALHSHPPWLVQLWVEQLGAADAEGLARAMSETPPVTLRVNTLRTSRTGLLERFAAAGVAASPTSYSPLGIRLDVHTPIAALPGYDEGLFTVQDEASQLVAQLLGPLPGDRILDLCAAPGGKATCLAELMANQGEIVACDSNPRRLAQIPLLAGRLGVGIIRTMHADAEQPLGIPAEGAYPRVLVDAPCSGLGVLRRNPEGKWWRTETDIATLAVRQRAILAGAAVTVAAGGLLLYATCSTSSAENEEVVEEFLSQHGDFVLEDVRKLFPQFAALCSDRGFFRSWPHRHGMDGFFAARLRKKDVS
jgi:16S rRNA (cytosine967-C5)-methyltransferase